MFVDAMSGFKEDKIEFLDLSDGTHLHLLYNNLPTPILLSYLRDIVLKPSF